MVGPIPFYSKQQVDSLFETAINAAGAGVASPNDGTVDALIKTNETNTRKTLNSVIDAHTGPLSRPSVFVGKPKVFSEVEVVYDSGGRTLDGSKFFTARRVGGAPYPDEWVAYVSGHDSKAIWLLSAPTLFGPWKWEKPVIGVSGSNAEVIDNRFGSHVASPSAVFRDGQIWLYYHGPLTSNGLEQPTGLAVSNNGGNFSLKGVVIPTEYNSFSSPYRTSTSYAKVIPYMNGYIAVWQGTSGYSTVTTSGNYSPLPTGMGYSPDGVSWRKQAPIVNSFFGDQGLLAPGVVKLDDGWMVVGSYRGGDGSKTGTQKQSVGVFIGESLDRLTRASDLILPGRTSYQYINSPEFHYQNGRMWMIGGTDRITGNGAAIIAFELRWE